MTKRIILVLAALLLFASELSAGVYRTANFHVVAQSDELARSVGLVAEHARDDIAVSWFGATFPRWPEACEIRVNLGGGAGGATTFAFANGVRGMRMTVQGSRERILDSVVPHEVAHTVFATHFRRPIPRWADEGMATLEEDPQEQARNYHRYQQLASRRQRMRAAQMIDLTDYPQDGTAVMALYSQGFVLTDFLVRREGKKAFVAFLETQHFRGWHAAFEAHYGIQVSQLDDVIQAHAAYCLQSREPRQSVAGIGAGVQVGGIGIGAGIQTSPPW